MIFNPCDWSTVVCLTALLICISLWEMSTTKISLEDWHEDMKINAEVATNVKRQESEIYWTIIFRTFDKNFVVKVGTDDHDKRQNINFVGH